MNFLVFWSICWSSSLVHIKNDPEYLTSETAQLFILLMRFLPSSLVLSSFPVLLKYSFLFFLSSPHVWWRPLPIFPSICRFPLLRVFWYFLDMVVLFLSSFVAFHFHYYHGTFFYAKFHSYILTVSPILFHCCKQFDIHIHVVVDFFLRFMKLVSASAFPKYVIEWHHCYYK